MPLTPPDDPTLPPLDDDPGPASEAPRAPSSVLEFSAESIRDLLLDLIPEAGKPVAWVDAAGRRYEAPPLLSARRQFLLLESAKGIAARLYEVVGRAAGEGRRVTVGALFREVFAGGEGAASAVLGGILDEVDRAFAVALPDQLEGARKALAAPSAMSLPASELFPLEEIAKALVPFYARPLAEIASLGEGRVAARLSR